MTLLIKCKFCGKGYDGFLKLQDHQKACLDNDEDDPGETSTVIISCRACKFVADTQEEFSKHYRDPKGGLNLECIEAGFRVKPKERLIKDRNETSKPMKCTVCGFSGNKTNLEEHVKNKHKDLGEDERIIFHCELCEKAFTSNGGLNHHYRTTHNGIREHECEICESKFFVKFELKKHMKKVHGEKQRKEFKSGKCIICLQTMKSSNIKRHMKEVHGNVLESHHCEICDYKTNHKRNLLFHQARHHSRSTPFKCNFCDYKAALKEFIRIHVRDVHERKERRSVYKCDVCDHSFKSSKELKSHARTHSTLKPFKCDLCEYSCKNMFYLKNHKAQVHYKLKDHKCETCGKTFDVKASLKRHISFIHEKDKTSEIKCEQCGFSTLHMSSLQRHVKLKHEDNKVKCDICGINLSKAGLKMHMKRIHEDKSHTCALCDYETSVKPDFLKHFENKHSV